MNRSARKNNIIIVFLIALITAGLFLPNCVNNNTLIEINRCLFINQKIDWAKNQLDELDSQTAQHDNYQIFTVGTEIYDFILDDGRTLKTMAFYPQEKTDKSPVVIFSHGFSASAESQLYLIRGLARRGYIVIAPDHDDYFNFDRIGLLDERLKINKPTDIIRALNYMIINLIEAEIGGSWDFMSQLDLLSDEEIQIMVESGELLDLFDYYFSYRIKDIEFIIDQLACLDQSDQILKGKIDLNKLIMAGHSLGGFAAMRLAIKDNPFQAFICLSPAVKSLSQNDLQLINKPVLYLSGDLDLLYHDTLQAFNFTLSPKIFVSIKNGGHIIFTDRVFLYGLGIPFLSEGEIGFANNLPDNKIDITPFTLYYPEQLRDYQEKAVSISRTVSAFIDLYVAGQNEQSLNIFSDLENDLLIDEFVVCP